MRNIGIEIENSFKIESQDNLSMTLQLLADKNWIFYQGHFPGLPILPAYAITEISVYFAQKWLGSSYPLGIVHGLRMRNPIIPGVPVQLKLLKNSDSCRFQMTWNSTSTDQMLLATIDYELVDNSKMKETNYENA